MVCQNAGAGNPAPVLNQYSAVPLVKVLSVERGIPRWQVDIAAFADRTETADVSRDVIRCHFCCFLFVLVNQCSGHSPVA